MRIQTGGQTYLDIAGRQRHAFNENVVNNEKRIMRINRSMLIPVLEIDYRGYLGRRTKDIWEDQKAGGPNNLIP